MLVVAATPNVVTDIIYVTFFVTACIIAASAGTNSATSVTKNAARTDISYLPSVASTTAVLVQRERQRTGRVRHAQCVGCPLRGGGRLLHPGVSLLGIREGITGWPRSSGDSRQEWRRLRGRHRRQGLLSAVAAGLAEEAADRQSGCRLQPLALRLVGVWLGCKAGGFRSSCDEQRLRGAKVAGVAAVGAADEVLAAGTGAEGAVAVAAAAPLRVAVILAAGARTAAVAAASRSGAVGASAAAPAAQTGAMGGDAAVRVGMAGAAAVASAARSSAAHAAAAAPAAQTGAVGGDIAVPIGKPGAAAAVAAAVKIEVTGRVAEFAAARSGAWYTAAAVPTARTGAVGKNTADRVKVAGAADVVSAAGAAVRLAAVPFGAGRAAAAVAAATAVAASTTRAEGWGAARTVGFPVAGNAPAPGRARGERFSELSVGGRRLSGVRGW